MNIHTLTTDRARVGQTLGDEIPNLASPDLVKIQFPYGQEKGEAVLMWLLREMGGRYNYMALLKLAFFADR